MIKAFINNGFIASLIIAGNIALAESSINVEKKLSLASNKIKEACFYLQQNQQVIFSFKASDPIKFNIHYHIDKDIFYPIAEQLTPAFKPTTFTASSTQNYCLMWSNHQATPVSLSFNIQSVE